MARPVAASPGFEKSLKRLLQLCGLVRSQHELNAFMFGINALDESLDDFRPEVTDEHQDAAAVVGINSPLDDAASDEFVDVLRERRAAEQHPLGEFTHRMALGVGQHLQDAPMFFVELVIAD